MRAPRDPRRRGARAPLSVAFAPAALALALSLTPPAAAEPAPAAPAAEPAADPAADPAAAPAAEPAAEPAAAPAGPPYALGAYPLDAVSREVPTKGKLRCPQVDLVRYAGEALPFHKSTLAHPAFLPSLLALERLAAEAAVEVYGRAPARLKHLGTFNCRRIGGYRHLMSEHSLANAIDLEGFDFAALPADAAAPEGLPRALRGPFKVRLLDHWRAPKKSKSTDPRALHARFLRLLARRLIDQRLFRVTLGPSYPGHKNHFHLDQASYELVSVF